jgi:hypothetical protein
MLFLPIICLSICIAAHRSGVTRNLKPDFWDSSLTVKLSQVKYKLCP